MSRHFIVVDRTRARIYKTDPFELVETLSNPLGRERNKDLSADSPGWSRSKFSQPSSTHALTGEKNPHEEAAIAFGRYIAHFLEKNIKAGKIETASIVCESKMMGRVRASLQQAIDAKLQWLRKDFGHFTDYQVGKTLGLLEPRPVA